MLSVSFTLAGLAAMQIGIVVMFVQKEVDSLNGPTQRPIPWARNKWGSPGRLARPSPTLFSRFSSSTQRIAFREHNGRAV